MAINKKTRKGSDLTLTGALRKLSFFSSAVTVLTPVERREWYWEVIQKADYEATSKFDRTLDMKRFIDVILTECRIIEEKEKQKNEKEN